MNSFRYVSLMALTLAVPLVGCAAPSDEGTGVASDTLIEPTASTTFVYFRSNDTSWDANAASAAPVRKGLADVADFTNRRLEGYTGQGINTEQDVRTMLTRMENHWNWARRGLEKTVWDYRRVTLDTPMMADIDGGYPVYRSRVIDALRALPGFNSVDYDVNSDGVMNGIWISPLRTSTKRFKRRLPTWSPARPETTARTSSSMARV